MIAACCLNLSLNLRHCFACFYICAGKSTLNHSDKYIIGHVNNIPTMQFFTGISGNTQSKLYTLQSAECVWDFQNDALWDTH